MKLYHFTSRVHLPLILDAGFLAVTESNASMDQAHAAPGCVWFATVAAPQRLRGVLSGASVNKTEVRFTVEVPDAEVVTWAQFKDDYKVEPFWAQALERFGDAGLWRMVFRPVARDEWVDVAVFEGAWRSLAVTPGSRA